MAATASGDGIINDERSIRHAWQGHDGSVYAAAWNPPHDLLRWTGKDWEQVAGFGAFLEFALETRAGPTWMIGRVPGGKRHLWRWDGPGSGPVKVDVLPEDMQGSFVPDRFSIREDKEGRVWMCGRDPRIFVMENDTFRVFHHLTDEQIFVPERHSEEKPAQWMPLRVDILEDGRVVFASSNPASRYRSLDGFLLVTGEDIAWIPQASLADLPDGEDLYFLHAEGNGIYFRKDHSGRAIVKYDPDAGTFEIVREIPYRDVPGTFYGWWPGQEDETERVMTRRRINIPEQISSHVYTMYYYNEYGWKLFADDIPDVLFSSILMQNNLPILCAEDAVWFGSRRHGLVRVDLGDASVRLANWRNGLRVDYARWVFRLPDGNLWVGGPTSFHGSASFNPDHLDLDANIDDRIYFEMDLIGVGAPWKLTQAADGSVFRMRLMRASGSLRRGLEKWIGNGWERVARDDGYTPRFNHLVADHANRVWAVTRPDEGERTAWILDAGEGAWVAKGNFHELLLEYASGEGSGFLPRPMHRHDRFLPAIANDGAVMYFSGSNHVIFHDGERWWNWDWADIDLSDRTRAQPADQIIYFDNKDGFGLLIEDDAWRLDRGGVWHFDKGPYQIHEIATVLQRVSREDHNDFREKLYMDPSRTLALSDKTFWVHHNQNLYRVFGSYAVRYLPEGLRHPFYRGEVSFHSQQFSLIGYFQDMWGNHVFITNYSGIIAVPPNEPASTPPTLSMEVRDGKHVLVEISETVGLLCWRWRLNDYAWSEWGRDTLLEGRVLPPGKYRVELQAACLNGERVATVMAEEILDYDLKVLIENSVHAVFDNDWNKRNQAVQHLVKAPGFARDALTALNIDPDTLTPDDRWWWHAAHEALARAPEDGFSSGFVVLQSEE